jgi:hypothetical protein
MSSFLLDLSQLDRETVNAIYDLLCNNGYDETVDTLKAQKSNTDEQDQESNTDEQDPEDK